MFYVISYDIVSNKRRRRVAKYLESYGIRVQYSVFETELNQEQIKTLIKQLKKKIDKKKDTIRIYPISKETRKSITTIGMDKGKYYDKEFIII
jgi:CRISPR-associated protein Cas2